MAAKTPQEKLNELIEKKPKIDLRPYQKDCIDAILKQPVGSRMMVVMATGLGKTAMFANIPRRGKKVLILVSGKELVINPLGYYDCPVGVEMGDFHAKRDFPEAQVISASVPSIVRRLESYDPKEFGLIIVDEAHHAAAKTYRTVIDYFEPDYFVGVTATPRRGDGVRLDDIFSKIVYSMDLKKGITDKFLCDICPRRVTINVDLRNIKQNENSLGIVDFDKGELARAMAGSAPAVAEVYKQYGIGPTLIAVSSVKLAYEVAALIPNATPVTGEMSQEDRAVIFANFRKADAGLSVGPVLVGVDVFREGVDIPNAVTVIIARPTLSDTLYIQIAGRGTRLAKGKKYLNLIDVEGLVADGVTLCSALTLAGIDASKMTKRQREHLDGVMVSDMEEEVEKLVDSPESWKFGAEIIEAWASISGYDLHKVNWCMLPDGHFELRFSHKETNQRYFAYIPAPDALGYVTIGCTRMLFQIALDLFYDTLEANYSECRALWDRDVMKKWGVKPATERQLDWIRRVLPDFDTTDLSMELASRVISRLIANDTSDYDDDSIRIYPVDPDVPPEHFSAFEEIKERRRSMTLYTYKPAPEFRVDVTTKTLAKDIDIWLERKILRGFRKECNGDIEQLIGRINKSSRQAYARLFLKQTRKYRYLCSLNKKATSRKEIVHWISRYVDRRLPYIINTVCIVPYAKEEEHKRPNLKVPPLNALTFEYADSVQVRKKGKSELPEVMAEVRQKAMEKWAADEQNKKKAAGSGIASEKRPRGRPKKVGRP